MEKIEQEKLEAKQQIDGFDEVMHYFYIDVIGGAIWRMNHDVSHGRMVMTSKIQEEMQELSELQQYSVQQLMEFGVDPESTKDRIDGDYWKWYRHWDDWKKAMTDEEWEHFDNVMSKEEDYEELLPKNKWNEI